MNLLGFNIQRYSKSNLSANDGLKNAFTEIASGRLDKLSPEAKSILKTAQKLAAKDPAKFFASFVQWQHHEYTKEIAHWKLAREAALSSNFNSWVELIELYDSIALDAFICGTIEKRRVPKISNKNFKLVNELGVEMPEFKQVLNAAWFTSFIKHAMRSKFYGHSLVYFFDWQNGLPVKTHLVPRTNVSPMSNCFYLDITTRQATYYNTQPFSQYMLAIDGEEGLGDFDKAAPLYILKKHSWSAWDRFEELFGVPLRIAKTASTDKKVLDSIESWLNSMGMANYGIFPQDTEMDVVANSQTDSFQVFNEKRKAANEELEILFLGQKRNTLQGGSLAKEQILQTDADEVTKDDMRFIANIVNGQLLPLLRANGVELPTNVSFVWDTAESLSTLERLSIYESFNNMGFKINTTQLAEEMGVEITGQVNTTLEQIDFTTSQNILAMHNNIKNIYV